MSETIFFRLLGNEDKGDDLKKTIENTSRNTADDDTFLINPNAFRTVPKSPFSYWVSSNIRDIFSSFDRLESEFPERKVTQGMSTAGDPRFVRIWTELPFSSVQAWFPFAKGGAYSTFYSDLHLAVNWLGNGAELKAAVDHRIGSPGQWSRWINAVDYYFRPGLTWSRRSQKGISIRVMTAGCIFADKGPAIFFEKDKSLSLLTLLSITNSAAFRLLITLQMAFGSYEVGVLQRTPIPEPREESEPSLAALARRAWQLKRNLDTIAQISHAFTLPALLQTQGSTLTDCARFWTTKVTTTEQQLSNIQSEIDEIAFKLYDISLEEISDDQQSTVSEADSSENEDLPEPTDLPALTHSLIEYTLGTALGRFDIRLATGERNHPPEPEPFDPLPVCSPGMLVTDDNLPPTTPEELPPNYPIDIPFDGILVDDESHPNDIIRRIRPVFDIIFSTQAGDIEQEACQLLKTASLRTYLTKPTAFFTQHLSRYSKSRRYAPIYLPLSTSSGSYTLWIYYHRLTDQTLYTCINNYIEPKLTQTSRAATQLLAKTNRTSDDETHLETLQTLEQELTELRDELLHIAQLPYKPNLNDGVQITAAPLWKCFRLKKWQAKLEGTWKQIEKGDYDWAHLAYSIWPERVAAKCKQDKSLAIAHNLENLYEPPPEKPKKQRKRSRKKT